MSNLIEPVWLNITQVRMMHSESLDYFGGMKGIRDLGLLESALERPKNKWRFDSKISLFELAASYGFGIAKNHAFMDGNKRTSLLAIRAFLFLNGYHFVPSEVETVTSIEGLAAGKVDEQVLAGWIEVNSSFKP